MSKITFNELENLTHDGMQYTVYSILSNGVETPYQLVKEVLPYLEVPRYSVRDTSPFQDDIPSIFIDYNFNKKTNSIQNIGVSGCRRNFEEAKILQENLNLAIEVAEAITQQYLENK